MKKLLIHTYQDEDRQIQKANKYKFISVWLTVIIVLTWFFIILFIPKSHAYDIDTVCMS